MYSRYFYWQFIVAPLWLIKLAGNFQLALLNLFSVPIMFSTLFSYWHKDSVSLQQHSISGIFQAMALNTISRAVGFVIRSIILIAWFFAAIFVLLVSIAVVILFYCWPWLAIAAIAQGALLMLGGGL